MMIIIAAIIIIAAMVMMMMCSCSQSTVIERINTYVYGATHPSRSTLLY